MSMSLWSLLHSLSLSLSAFNIFSLKEEKKTETVKEATHLSLSLPSVSHRLDLFLVHFLSLSLSLKQELSAFRVFILFILFSEICVSAAFSSSFFPPIKSLALIDFLSVSCDNLSSFVSPRSKGRFLISLSNLLSPRFSCYYRVFEKIGFRFRNLILGSFL